MAIFTAIAAGISAIAGWTISLGALGTFAIGNFLLQTAVSLGVSALTAALAGKPKKEGFSIKGSVRTGGSTPRSFMLGPSLTAGSLVWHTEWGQDGKTPNAYYTQVIALSDLPVAGLRRWFIDGRAVTLEDTGDERGLAAVEYRAEGGGDHAWIKFYDGNQTEADPFLVGTVSKGGPRVYSPSRVGWGVAYAVVTFAVHQEIFTGFPRSKFVLDGVKLYDPSKDTTNGGTGTQRWDDRATWGGDGDALPAVQAYNLARGLTYAAPALSGAASEDATIPLGEGVQTISLEIIGGGGGGKESALAGGDTVVTLKDGATVIQTWTASGGAARSAGAGGGVSPRPPYGAGAPGQEELRYTGGKAEGEIRQTGIAGGAAGTLVTVVDFDVSALADPILEITAGAGAPGAGSGAMVFTGAFVPGAREPQWFYGLQGLTAARLPAAHWISQIEKCRAQIEGPDGLEPTYRSAGEITVNSEIGAAFEALLTACAGRMSEVGGIFKIYVGGPDAPVASFGDADIVSLAPQSFTPFHGLSDTVNGVIGSYPSPDEAYVMRAAPPIYRPDFEVEDGGRRLMADVQLTFVPFPAQAQRLLAGELAAARRARRHTFTLPARYRLIEPGDVVTWDSERNGYEGKSFRVDGVIDLPNCDLIVDLTEVDPADHGNWQHSRDYTPVNPAPLLPVRPVAQAVAGFGLAAHDVQDGTGAARRPGIRIIWDASIEGVSGLMFEVRVQNTGAMVAAFETLDFSAGGYPISEGILPGTYYEARAKYIPADGRAVAWTHWEGVLTSNLRFGGDDLTPAIRDNVEAVPQIAIDLLAARDAADSVRADHDALVSGFGGDLSGLAGQISGLLPSGFSSRETWQGASTFANPGPSIAQGVAYDSALSADAVTLGPGNVAIGPKGVVQVDPSGVYEIEVKGRVAENGALAGRASIVLGFYGWDEAGVLVSSNIQSAEFTPVVADGVFHFTYVIAGADALAAAGVADRTLSAGVAQLRPHVRVNAAGNSDALVSVSMLAVREITGKAKADYTDARLSEDYMTTEGVNGAIALKATELSAETARAATVTALNDDMSDLGNWVGGYSYSAPARAAAGDPVEVYPDELSVVAYDGEGSVLRNDGIYRVISERHLRPMVEGQKWKLRIRSRVVEDFANPSLRVWIVTQDKDGTYTSYADVQYFYNMTAADGWQEYSLEVDPHARFLAVKGANTAVKWGLMFSLNYGVGGAEPGVQEVSHITLENVTAADDKIATLSASISQTYMTQSDVDAASAVSLLQLVSDLSSEAMPSTFNQDGKFWTHDIEGDAEAAAPLSSVWSFKTVSGRGRVASAVADGAGNYYLLTRGLISAVQGRKYRITAVMRKVGAVNGSPHISMFFRAQNEDNVYQAVHSFTSHSLSADFAEYVAEWTHNGTHPFLRPGMYVRSSATGGGSVEVLSIKVEDITETDALSATVTAQGSTLATLQDGVSAGYLIKAQAGNAVSLIDLIAADGSGETASVAKIQAQDILLDGSVYMRQLAVMDTSKVFSETFEHYDPDDWEFVHQYGNVGVKEDVGTEKGGKVLELGNRSGNDQVWMVHKRLIPFDAEKTYRFRVRVWRESGSNGNFYAGFAGVNRDGGTLENIRGETTQSSQHYHACSGEGYQAGWVVFEGYTKGRASTGSAGPGVKSVPAKAHNDVRYMRPMILANYNGQAGRTYVDYLEIEELSDAATIADGAVKAEHIEADAVEARHVKAGAITARELSIGDFINLGGGTDILSVWDGASKGYSVNPDSNPAHPSRITYSPGGADMYRPSVPVTPGDQFYASMWVYCMEISDAGNTKLRFSTEEGHLYSVPINNAPNRSWTKLGGDFTIPNGAKTLEMAFWNKMTGGNCFIAEINIFRKNTGDVLVDGSVRADKIQIDDVTLDSDGNGNLIIKNNGVNRVKILDGAVSEGGTDIHYPSGTHKPDVSYSPSTFTGPMTWDNVWTLAWAGEIGPGSNTYHSDKGGSGYTYHRSRALCQYRTKKGGVWSGWMQVGGTVWSGYSGWTPYSNVTTITGDYQDVEIRTRHEIENNGAGSAMTNARNITQSVKAVVK